MPPVVLDRRLITSERVRQLYAKLLFEYDATWEPKAEAAIMQDAAPFVERQTGIPRKVFLTGYATTITWLDKATLYLPFEPGVAGENGHWSFDAQIEIIAHELEHSVQARRHPQGPLGFSVEYLAREASRGFWESEAMVCGETVNYHFTGRWDESTMLRRIERGYGCSQATVQSAYRMFTVLRPTVVNGGVLHKPAQDVINFFKQEAA